jgi:hypothetical protein
VAERKVTVNVALQASGNLAQVAGQAAAQAAKLNQAAKGAGTAAQQARAAITPAGAAAAAHIPATAAGVTATANVTRQLTGALARQQDQLGRVVRERGFLAGFDRFREQAEPLTRAARFGGAGLLGATYGGIASVSPEASSQITNSFRMIANEIGIATIPSAVGLTRTLQGASRAIRIANEASHGWLGTLTAYGGLGLTGLGALGLAAGPVRAGAGLVTSGLRASGLMRQAAATAGGEAAGQAAATGGRAAGAGGLAVGGPAALAVATTLGTIAGIADAFYSSAEASEFERRGGAAALGPEQRRQYENVRTASRVPVFGAGFNFGTSIRNAFREESQRVPTFGLGSYLASFVGGNAGAADRPLQDVSEHTPRFYQTAEELQNALTMRVAGTPGPLAEQETRAMGEWIAAIERHRSALEANTAAAAGMTSWGPPSTENG